MHSSFVHVQFDNNTANDPKQLCVQSQTFGAATHVAEFFAQVQIDGVSERRLDCRIL